DGDAHVAGRARLEAGRAAEDAAAVRAGVVGAARVTAGAAVVGIGAQVRAVRHRGPAVPGAGVRVSLGVRRSRIVRTGIGPALPRHTLDVGRSAGEAAHAHLA